MGYSPRGLRGLGDLPRAPPGPLLPLIQPHGPECAPSRPGALQRPAPPGGPSFPSGPLWGAPSRCTNKHRPTPKPGRSSGGLHSICPEPAEPMRASCPRTRVPIPELHWLRPWISPYLLGPQFPSCKTEIGVPPSGLSTRAGTQQALNHCPLLRSSSRASLGRGQASPDAPTPLPRAGSTQTEMQTQQARARRSGPGSAWGRPAPHSPARALSGVQPGSQRSV